MWAQNWLFRTEGRTQSEGLPLREERRLKVFENGVLRRIFGLRSDGVIGEWRKLFNDELYDLYSSSNAGLL